MSTVTEIKQAVSKLPPQKKRELVRWMQTQVGGGTSDEVNRATRMSEDESADAKRFLSDFVKAVKTVAAGPRPRGSVVATLAKMRR